MGALRLRLSDRVLTALWLVTGAAALLLLAATIALSIRAGDVGELPSTAIVVDSNSPVFLRASPKTSSRIITVLESGTILTVLEKGADWHNVETSEVNGWVQADLVKLGARFLPTPE